MTDSTEEHDGLVRNLANLWLADGIDGSASKHSHDMEINEERTKFRTLNNNSNSIRKTRVKDEKLQSRVLNGWAN